MGLLNKLINIGTETGVTLLVRAPLETAWAGMLAWCIEQGYWISESDQAARQFTYFVPPDYGMSSVKKMLSSGNQVIVCVASLGAEACAISVTANSYHGETSQSILGKQNEFVSKPRQLEIIGWLVAFIESKFAVVRRSATPSTQLPAARSQGAAPPASKPSAAKSGSPSFDFLQK